MLYQNLGDVCKCLQQEQNQGIKCHRDNNEMVRQYRAVLVKVPNTYNMIQYGSKLYTQTNYTKPGIQKN